MKEDYAITIKGRQVYEDEDQGEICLSALGTYREKDGTRFILYKEYDDDDANVFRTALLKVEPGMVTMSRSGSSTRLILEKGRRHLCLYDTGFGTLTVGVYTSRLDVDLDDTGGKLEIAYTLDVDSNLSSQNLLSVEVSPVPEALEI